MPLEIKKIANNFYNGHFKTDLDLQANNQVKEADHLINEVQNKTISCLRLNK